MELTDKTCIITGASAGISSDLALGFAGSGAYLVLNARTVKPLAETTAGCEAFGLRAIYVAGDAVLASAAGKMVAEGFRSVRC